MQFSPVRTSGELDAALQTLSELNRVMVIKEGRKVLVHINPLLKDEEVDG